MNIVVLGGSYLQSDFIETARKMCDHVYVLDKDPHCYARNIEHVNFSQIDILDVNKIEQFVSSKKCDLIVSPAMEIGNRIAVKVAHRIGMPYNSLASVNATTDKWMLRNQLKDTKLIQPKFERFKSIDQINNNFMFPLMVKPPVGSASRGVTLVENQETLNRALNYAKKYCEDIGDILIEEYIEGKQYSIETISSQGRHFIAAITRQYMSGAPYIFARTQVILMNDNKILHNKLQTYIEQLLNILDIEKGPCHIEIKIKDDEIYLIEAASRSGGFRGRLMNAAGCSNYNELIIKSYTDKQIHKEDILDPERCSLVGILTTPSDLEVYLKAKKNGLIVSEYFRGKGPEPEPKSVTDAFGYFFINGENNILNYQLT